MAASLAQSRTPFAGCKLSLQLNGQSILTLEEGNLIQAILSFIGQNQNDMTNGREAKDHKDMDARNGLEAKHVKVVVFDEQNRVLAIKSRNRFLLPGGRVEWDDDDAEAAARREVFEAANIALGIVKPVTVIKTKSRQNQTAQTIVFVGRLRGEAQASDMTRRFMDKETFFETPGGQGRLVRSLVEAAQRVLVSEEIKSEHNQETDMGRVLVASKR